jgi:hypothetical protein
MYQSEMDAAGERQTLPVDFRSADHHQRGLRAGRDSRIVESLNDQAIARRKFLGTAQHDIHASRQRLADGVVRLAAHQHGLAEGKRFEMP